MFTIFSRTTMTGAATAVLLGTSLLLPPAAEAAPRHAHSSAVVGVDVGAKHESFSFRVGSRRDRLTLDPIGTATRRVEIAGRTVQLPARFRLALTRGKHVLLGERASTWPALLASLAITVGSNTSDAKARTTITRALALPAGEAKAGVEATFEQLNDESTATVGAASVARSVEQWREDHPDATTLDGYSLPAELAHVGEGLGSDLTISGTPQHFTVRAVVAANGAVVKLSSDGHHRYSRGFLSGRVLKNRLR